MKRLKDVRLYTKLNDASTEVRALSFSGNALCQVANQAEVTALVRDILPEVDCSACYIVVSYVDGSTEMLSPSLSVTESTHSP